MLSSSLVHGNIICPGCTHRQLLSLAVNACERTKASDNKSTWARRGSFYLNARGVTSVEAVCYFYCLIIMARQSGPFLRAKNGRAGILCAQAAYCPFIECVEVKKSESTNNGHAEGAGE